MATGALDAQGVYQYGEDDIASLVSDLLNKLAASTSTQFAADRVRIAAAETKLAYKRSYVQNITAGPVNNGVALGSAFATPALPVAVRIMLDMAGTVGNAGGAAQVGVNVANTAGARQEVGNYAVNQTANALWVPYARKLWIDLPANQACSITFTSNTTLAAYFRLGVEARILLPGEY